ncbi:MAG: LmeA family phospholipid-binding protein [Gordonia sp. (in: high G+C Gram-positive bacteria)]
MWRFAVNKAASEAVKIAKGTDSAPLRRRRRGVLITLAALLIIAVTAVLADTAAAITGEYRLSRALLAAPRVSFDPEVTIGGFPYAAHAAGGTFPGAVITARGVAVAGCGIHGGCRAELGARLGRFRVGDGWRIDRDDTMHVSAIHAYTRLDSVNLGRFLNILDLTVNTPAPAGTVGGGGPQDGLLQRTSGIALTGTVALPPTNVPVTGYPTPVGVPSSSKYPGRKAKVCVTVDVSVHDRRLHLQATGLCTGPENHVTADAVSGPGNAAVRTAVLARFSTTLPPLPLPWGLAPTGAHSEGSDVLLVADSGPRDLRPDKF